MGFQRNSGRPPLAGRIDARTTNTIRRLYLSGATMADIGNAIGESYVDVYQFVARRRERWLRDNDFERRATALGHLVVWKNCSHKTGGCVVRPITLPGTTMQRNMMAEAGR